MTKRPDDHDSKAPRLDDTMMLAGVTGEDLPTIPDVEIQYEIGRGGMGVVYRGRQSYISRDVAVKVLVAGSHDAEFARRFKREATILAKLTHPHIVACHSGGVTQDGRCFLVMEYIDGPDLFERLEESGSLQLDEALDITRDLADALRYAKQEGVIHRDVKPANVLLQRKPDGGYQVKLADLGLARPEVADQTMMDITRSGAVMGSPATMAPEQFDDPDSVDHRADIYGLGCVLFHALTGRVAYPQKTLSATIASKMQPQCPDPRDLRKEVPPGVTALVRDLLAKKAEERPQTYEEIIDRIGALRGKAAAGGGGSALLPIAGLLAVAAVGGGFWWLELPPFGERGPSAEEIARVAEEERLAALKVQRLKEVEEERLAEIQRQKELQAEAEAEAERKRQVDEAAQLEREKAEAEAARLAQVELDRQAAEQRRLDRERTEAEAAERLEALRIAALAPPLAVGDVRALFADDPAFPLPEPWEFLEGDVTNASLNPEVEGRVLSMNSGRGAVVASTPLPTGPWTLEGSFRLTGNKNPFEMRAELALELGEGERFEFLQRRAKDSPDALFTATLAGVAIPELVLETVKLEGGGELSKPTYLRVEALQDGSLRLGWGPDPDDLATTTLPADVVGTRGAPRALLLGASVARVHFTDLRLSREK